MFWTFKNAIRRIWKWDIFSVFCDFLSDDVETIFWKKEAKYLKLLKSKFSHRKHFRKCFLELPWALKQMFWAFGNGTFQCFCKFLRNEVKSYFCFQSTLRSKTNVLSLWKWYFSIFCNILSDEVETVYWKSKTKRSKLFKLKLSHRKLFRNLFWSHFEVQNECPEPLGMAFFTILWIFEWRSWSRLLENWGKAL